MLAASRVPAARAPGIRLRSLFAAVARSPSTPSALPSACTLACRPRPLFAAIFAAHRTFSKDATPDHNKEAPQAPVAVSASAADDDKPSAAERATVLAAAKAAAAEADTPEQLHAAVGDHLATRAGQKQLLAARATRLTDLESAVAAATCDISRGNAEQALHAQQMKDTLAEHLRQGHIKAVESGPVGRPIPDEQSHMRLRKKEENVSWRTAALTIATAVLLLGAGQVAMVAWRERKSQRVRTELTHIGDPDLGRPWTMIDCDSGKLVTQEDFKGRYTLYYFGFSWCPDICPDQLVKLTDVCTELRRRGVVDVQQVFVTIDPNRDTVAQTRAYIDNFRGAGRTDVMRGLTGTSEMVKHISRGFRVYFNDAIRVSDEDYLVDHSIIHYLMDPHFEFVEFYGQNLTADELLERVENDVKRRETQMAERAAKRVAKVHGTVE